jgi:hypothetical protein
MSARLLLLAPLLLAACFPKAAPPPPGLFPKQLELAQAKAADVTPESLEHGRLAFVDSCGQCHDHPDLSAYKLSKWPKTVDDMIGRAEIKDDEVKRDVRRFVLTAAEAANAPP